MPSARFQTLIAVAVVLALPGCALVSPSNSRNWAPDQAVLARADIEGPTVRVHNIRNCAYRTVDDYTANYYDKTYNLNELNSVWFFVVPFAEMPVLAHTMLSFGFADRDYLAVSVEVRKEKGESYAALTGMMNRFEVMYVVGDERDVVALRTNYRLNEVYMYRARATPEQARTLFLDVMRRVNKLAVEPEYYNTLTNNCTTNIMRHVNRLSPHAVPYDWRVLLPGQSDRLAYDRGLLDTNLSFEETKLRARINERAYQWRDSPNFSVAIRSGNSEFGSGNGELR
jgi:hypothetical protein